MNKLLRKRRTREHVIADLSVNYVERQSLLCGFAVEHMVEDYGIDMELLTFTPTGEIEAGKILVQVKAPDDLKRRRGQACIPFQIERRDLVSWLSEPMPVIFVVYDAIKDAAFWIYVQSLFAKRKDFNLFTAGKSITVEIPVANTLNVTAMRKFARCRDRAMEQMRGVSPEEN
jgi:Domain of unknown function (DUF4365)